MNPVLIYKSADVCYNILNYMAQRLGDALEKLGIVVMYYDPEKEGAGGISGFLGKEFSAVVGFQTFVFDIFLPSRNCYLHDMIRGPKFHVLLDHPIWMREHLEQCPKDYYVLTHDSNYIDFIKRHFSDVSDAFLFPPGGTQNLKRLTDKTKDLIFLGTYCNYREVSSYLHSCNKDLRSLSNRYLLELRKNYNDPAELVLDRMLSEAGIETSGTEYMDIFSALIPMVSYAISYYREKVVKTILDSEIKLTVYGDSWKNSPFADNKYLEILPEVSPEKSIEEYASAKASLNVMAWHKAGFTERIANSMLNRSVVVSDRTTCLEQQYRDDEELILFDLGHLEELPGRIKALLSDGHKCEQMADKAYSRALVEDTWTERAKLLIEYIKQTDYGE